MKITCKSYSIVVECLMDPLLQCKLACFSSMAQCVEPFLTLYQTDRPVLAFLAADLESMLRKLMKRFVKNTVLTEADTVMKLVAVDIVDVENLKGYSSIDCGFVANKRLKELLSEKKVSERPVLAFKMETRSFLTGIVQKLLVKNPLKYPLVRNVVCLSPAYICTSKSKSANRFRRILEIMTAANHVAEQDCDKLEDQFTEFLGHASRRSDFKEFDYRKDRLDQLYFQCLNGCEQWGELWNVIRKLLLLSHGQASVERGFSVNRQTMDQNLSAEGLVARRLVKDYVISVGGIKNVTVNSQMLKAASAAHTKYFCASEDKKAASAMSQNRKRKQVEEDLESLKKKRKSLIDDVASLEKSADDMAQKAEAARSVKYITQSNSLRRSMHETRVGISSQENRNKI